MFWNDNPKKKSFYIIIMHFLRHTMEFMIANSISNYIPCIKSLFLFSNYVCTWCTDVRKYIVEDRVMKNRVTSFLKENLYSVCVGFEAWFQRTELIFKFNTWNLFKVNFCSKFGFSQHKSVSYSLGRKPQL